MEVRDQEQAVVQDEINDLDANSNAANGSAKENEKHVKVLKVALDALMQQRQRASSAFVDDCDSMMKYIKGEPQSGYS